MKARKISSITALYMVFTAMAFAESPTTTVEESEERLYVESGIVQIADRGIFLNWNEKVLPITGIAQDEKGIYVTVDQAAVDMTTCRRCGKDYDADNQSKKCPHGWILIR